MRPLRQLALQLRDERRGVVASLREGLTHPCAEGDRNSVDLSDRRRCFTRHTATMPAKTSRHRVNSAPTLLGLRAETQVRHAG